MSGLVAVVKEELDKQGKNWRWLSIETGIAESTFTKWRSEPDLVPDLRTLALISVKLGLSLRRLIEACGFTVNESADYTDRSARARALVAAVPQLELIADEFAGLNPEDQDAFLAMVRAFRKDRTKPKRRQ